MWPNPCCLRQRTAEAEDTGTSIRSELQALATMFSTVATARRKFAGYPVKARRFGGHAPRQDGLTGNDLQVGDRQRSALREPSDPKASSLFRLPVLRPAADLGAVSHCRSWRRSWPRFSPVGNADLEAGAGAGVRQADGAAMGADQFGGNRKTEARAALSRRCGERLEKGRAQMFRHARTGVADLDQRRAVAAPCAHLQPAHQRRSSLPPSTWTALRQRFIRTRKSWSGSASISISGSTAFFQSMVSDPATPRRSPTSSTRWESRIRRRSGSARRRGHIPGRSGCSRWRGRGHRRSSASRA